MPDLLTLVTNAIDWHRMVHGTTRPHRTEYCVDWAYYPHANKVYASTTMTQCSTFSFPIDA